MTLRGMATVNYFAADWAAARAWYTTVTGIEPYFLRDGYAEWRLGDHQAELGLIDSRFRKPAAAATPGSEPVTPVGPGSEPVTPIGPGSEPAAATTPDAGLATPTGSDGGLSTPATRGGEPLAVSARGGEPLAVSAPGGEPLAVSAPGAEPSMPATPGSEPVVASAPGGESVAVTGPVGAVLYWHVDDLEAELARLVELGATVHEPAQHRGHGFVTATVIDPFGNLLGIMYNPHYVEMAAAK